MSEMNFNATVESLFKGMDSFITTKTVVGDAIHIGDTIILPLVDVSFGVAAGAFSQDKKNNGAGGMGGKIMPSAVLVIQNGTTKLVNIKNQDGVTKILDMVPDFVNKFTSKGEKGSVEQKSEESDEAAKEAAAKDMEEQLKNARPDRVFITHSGCDRQIVDNVREYLESLGIFDEILETRAGGVISSHCGPGTLGVLFIAG